MAISTNTFTINAGYAKSDLLTQLETAFTWLGWHDKCDHTGIVTGIVDLGMYQDDPLMDGWTHYKHAVQYTSSGVGTDASFWVQRNSGNPYSVHVNQCGYGYTHGEYLEFLPGEATASAGSLGWGCTVYTSNTSYGTTTSAFYDKHLESGSTRNYGVLKLKVQDNKKYGSTYRIFSVDDTNSIKFASGPSFYPYYNSSGPWTSNTPPYKHTAQTSGPYYYPRISGDHYLDCQHEVSSQYNCPIDNSFTYQTDLTVASSGSYQLDLNVYRSNIDPKFVVFSYKQPTLSSTDIVDNTNGTFILHNFTTDIWDLDDVWLGGLTTILPDNTGETYNPKMTFRMYCGGTNAPQFTKRCAESAWDRHNDGVIDEYCSMVASGADDTYIYNYSTRMYNRDSNYDINQNSAGAVKSVNSNADYNAVIKGLPLNGKVLPCPKYMPDDFVIIDFDYATPEANIQQGDTITISGSEVYTVITGNYTRSTRTRGLLFCARTT